MCENWWLTLAKHLRIDSLVFYPIFNYIFLSSVFSVEATEITLYVEFVSTLPPPHSPAFVVRSFVTVTPVMQQSALVVNRIRTDIRPVQH